MAYGIKLIQNGAVLAPGTAVHPAPIGALEVGALCYLSFTGTTRTYEWVLTATPTGSTAVISSGSSPGPTFMPDVSGGTYSISLVDDQGAVYVLDVLTATNVFNNSITGVANVQSYGAKGDGVYTTASIAAGARSFNLPGLTTRNIGQLCVFQDCGAQDANLHVVPMAGTITDVIGSTVYVSFTAVTNATNRPFYYATDDSAAFQAAYAAIKNGGVIYVPTPAGSFYGIGAEWGGTKACRIVGDGRACTQLTWMRGPGAAAKMIRLYGGGIYESSIEHLNFTAPIYTTVEFCVIEDCTYFSGKQLTFSSYGGPAPFPIASNQTNAMHFKNLLTGQVPPRGNIHLADILITHEVDTMNGDGSHGLWIEGNAAQGFQQVTIEGETNLEQCEWGIRFDYVSNSIIKTTGLIQGNRHNVAMYNGDHNLIAGEVTCANAKRAVTLTNLRDIFVDVTCTNTQIYDPAATPARVEVNDASYMWIGCETRLCNLPSPTLRGTPVITGINGSRLGAGGYVSAFLLENTLNDGLLSMRVSMMHSSVQRDVYEEYWDYLGNRQHHHLLANGFESWYEGTGDSNPMGNVSLSGFQSSKKTANANVAARARFDALADTDDICVIAQAGTAQAKNLVESRNNAGAAIMSLDAAGRLKWVDSNQTQTTVGAAGGASAPPATPRRWLKIVDSDGTVLVVPAYLAS